MSNKEASYASNVSAAGSKASTSSGLASIVGSSQARFLGLYNPYYSGPIERPHLNSGVYLDPELTKMLEEDRVSREMTQHRRQNDEVKRHIHEVARYKAITGNKK